MRPYHVVLAGQGYLVDPASYVVQAVEPAVDLARGLRAAAPLAEQIQHQVRFTAGQGFATFTDPTDPNGWDTSRGVVVGGDGALRLGPAIVASAGDPAFAAGAQAWTVYRGWLYVGLDASPGEVWSFDGSTWRRAFSTGTAGVRALAVFRDALYVGCAGSGAVLRWDGSTLATAWTNTGVTAIHALAVGWFGGQPRLFVGNSTQPGQGWLQSFDGATQSIVAVVEEPSLDTLAILDGQLYVFASGDGVSATGSLYSYAGSSATFVHERAFEDGHATVAVVLGRRLVLGWSRGTALRLWEPGSRTLTSLPVPEAATGPRGLATRDGQLWLAGPSTAGVGLWQYEPETGAWVVLARSLPGSAVHALGASADRLFFAPSSATDPTIWTVDSATPGVDGEVVTAAFDGGLPGLPKAWRALDLHHDPLPSGASLSAAARLDRAGPWLPLLGSPDAGEATRFDFPAGSVGRSAVFRLHLEGSAGSGGLAVRALSARFTLAVSLGREWRFDVRLEGDAERPLHRLDYSVEPLSARDLAERLWALRATPGPLEFEDLFGRPHRVWLAEIKEVPLPRAALAPQSPWTTARVRLIEVGD